MANIQLAAGLATYSAPQTVPGKSIFASIPPATKSAKYAGILGTLGQPGLTQNSNEESFGFFA